MAVEPPDLFTRNMPAKYLDRAPRVIDHKGKDVWYFEDKVVPFPGLGSVAGRPPEEYGMEPVRFSQMRDGCYVRDARVDDMDANGMLAALCFPTWTDFAGTNYTKAKDKDLALATIQTYNDWHVDELAGGAPGRFIPLCVVPLWDVALAVNEARRLAAKRVHAITFPDNPAYIGTELLFDNVLIGEYLQVNQAVVAGNNALGNPMVHIRAIPEGGPANSPATTASRLLVRCRITGRMTTAPMRL